MFDIVTLEPEDPIVMSAVNGIVGGQEGPLPSPGKNYRLYLGSASSKEGDGGTAKHVVAIVGHGAANVISGHGTFKSYLADCSGEIDWKNATSIYLVACSTSASDGRAFLTGHIAQEVADTFPKAAVWASPTAVTAKNQAGDWDKVKPLPREASSHRESSGERVRPAARPSLHR